MISVDDLKVVTKRKPTEAELNDLIFAWKVAKFVKSNAIIYAKDRQTVGVGAGQMSRVNSARIAAIKAEQARSEEHTSELQSCPHLVCRLLLEKKKAYSYVCL